MWLACPRQATCSSYSATMCGQIEPGMPQPSPKSWTCLKHYVLLFNLFVQLDRIMLEPELWRWQCCNVKESETPASGIRFRSWPSTQKLKIFKRSEWSSEINTGLRFGVNNQACHTDTDSSWSCPCLLIFQEAPLSFTVVCENYRGSPRVRDVINTSSVALGLSYHTLLATTVKQMRANAGKDIPTLEKIGSIERENSKLQSVGTRRWSSPGL